MAPCSMTLLQCGTSRQSKTTRTNTSTSLLEGNCRLEVSRVTMDSDLRNKIKINYKQIKSFLFSPTKCTPQFYKAAHYNVME